MASLCSGIEKAPLDSDEVNVVDPVWQLQSVENGLKRQPEFVQDESGCSE